MTVVALDAQRDFNRAYGRARWQRFWGRLVARVDELVSFETLRCRVRMGSESYAGLKTVAIDRIVGSEGRSADFTGGFLPKSQASRHRWERVARAHREGRRLLPVLLLELEGNYYVRDGNHRVSVARSRGQQFIEAEVVRLKAAG